MDWHADWAWLLHISLAIEAHILLQWKNFGEPFFGITKYLFFFLVHFLGALPTEAFKERIDLQLLNSPITTSQLNFAFGLVSIVGNADTIYAVFSDRPISKVMP